MESLLWISCTRFSLQLMVSEEAFLIHRPRRHRLQRSETDHRRRGEPLRQDWAHMRLPQSQVDLIDAVAAVNPNIVAVMSAGSAVEMPGPDKCKALIHGSLRTGGSQRHAPDHHGADQFQRQAVQSYPLKYEDVSSAPYFPAKERNVEYRESLYVGYRYFETANAPVLFPFGFGLSYTTFAYYDLNVSDKEVTFTIKNTGGMGGAEVAQLYVSKRDGKVSRPVKELKSFQKVFLRAGPEYYLHL